MLPARLIVLDASVWISNLLPNDSNHSPAVAWLNNYLAGGGRLVAPVMLVLETAGAVSRLSQDQRLARRSIRFLYTWPFMRIVPIDQPLVDEATDVAIAFGLRGPDAVYVAMAKNLAIPLATFDQEQLTRPSSIIMTIRP